MIHTLKVQKTAKYVTYGDPLTANTIIFVLHGYGQLAEYFIRKFNVLDKNNFFIVAPEGLHRFYLKGSSGRVGASWMTKKHREDDINDYINYLDDLWLLLSKQYTFKHKILLGFSQGGATASRWHCKGIFNADKFLLWSAVFPPDMSKDYCSQFNLSKNYFIFGSKDEYYSADNVNEHYQQLKKLNFDFKLVIFKGNHNIDSKILVNLIK